MNAQDHVVGVFESPSQPLGSRIAMGMGGRIFAAEHLVCICASTERSTATGNDDHSEFVINCS